MSAKRRSGRKDNNEASLPPRRAHVILLVLALTVVVFLVTLPWQRRQWEQTRRLREETAAQETRIRDVRAQQAAARAAETRLKGASAGDLNARLDAARALLSHGDTTGAGNLLQEAEAAAVADPMLSHDAGLATSLAGLYQEVGWFDRALANAQRAVQLAPKDVAALVRLAVIEAQLGWSASCRAHVTQALALAPQAAEPHIALALMNDQVGANKEAEKELMAADRARPGDARIRLLLFRNRMNQRRYDDALEMVEVALRAHPADPALLSARAEALLERALSQPGKPDKTILRAALEAIQRYQQIVPEDTSTHVLMGKALRGMGDDAGAVREWETAYAAQPDQPDLAVNLGRLLVRQGQAERGGQLITAGEAARSDATEYNRLVTTAGMDLENPAKHRALARWCQAHGRLPRAILEWEQVLRLRPGDAEAMRERKRSVALRGQASARPPLAPPSLPS
jgi:Flp pilus assembly protein TadD